MRKLALLPAVAVLLLAIPSAAFAQENWQGLVHKGDFAAFVGIGFGWGVTVAPGVEWAFVDFQVGGTVPLAIGVTGRGEINFRPDYWTSYGLGALATVHLGLKGLDIPAFLQRLDIYLGAGVGVRFFSYDADSTLDYGPSKIGFATSDGVACHINDKWAGYLEFNWWSHSGGATLGVRYTF